MSVAGTMAGNYLGFCNAFPFSRPLLSAAAGLVTALRGQSISAAEAKALKSAVKQNVSIFSPARGTCLPLFAALLPGENTGAAAQKSCDVLEKLQSAFTRNGAGALAAVCAVRACPGKTAEELAGAVLSVFRLMQDDHGVLTGYGSLPAAAMFAFSGQDASLLEKEAEENARLLEHTFGLNARTLALSRVLALAPGTADEKCLFTERLYRCLRDCGRAAAFYDELPALGSLAGLSLSPEDAAGLVLEADEDLKSRKGFGAFTLGADSRLMFAALLTAAAKGASGELVINAAVTAVSLKSGLYRISRTAHTTPVFR